MSATPKHLNEMSDAEFETYLKSKYGEKWRFISLTPEEFERCPIISQEEIKERLAEGRKHRQTLQKIFDGQNRRTVELFSKTRSD